MSVLDRLMNPIGKEITLPSNGMFGGPSTVTVRGFVTKDDKDLLLVDSEFPMGQLRQIVQNVVIKPEDLMIDKLVEADVIAILTAARIMTYGDEVELSLVCGHCGAVAEKTFSLDKLKVTNLKGAPQGLKLTLKVSNVDIIYKLLTIGEQKVIEQNLRSTAQVMGDSPNISQSELRTAYAAGMIDMVNDGGELLTLSPLDKKTIVENLPKQDAIDWASDREKYDCGHHFETNNKCKACKEKTTHILVVGYDFFYSPMRKVLTDSIPIY